MRIFSPVRLLFCCLAVLLCGSACKDDSPRAEDTGSEGHDWEAHEPFVADYLADLLPVHGGYRPDPVAIGTLRLDESSGVGASVANPGMLWTHEDSGNTNMIFLVDGTTADVLCRYRVTGAANQDWEDLEVVLDPVSGRSYIYVADTGDNGERRPTVSVYRVEEPVYQAGDYGKTLDIPVTATRYTLRYPDGPKDVESMFVDAETEDVYFVTKRDAASRVYVMPAPHATDGANRTYLVGELGFREASAGTLNFKGDKLIIRNRQNLFYWERRPDEGVHEMLVRTPQRLPYVGEVQGEAVCFDRDDNYYTTSERAGLSGYPPIYKYLKQ